MAYLSQEDADCLRLPELKNAIFGRIMAVTALVHIFKSRPCWEKNMFFAFTLNCWECFASTLAVVEPSTYFRSTGTLARLLAVQSVLLPPLRRALPS